ncbi:MAG: hypothetical protein HC828_15220 [Blastochloris sp.]|nr:hypothetical protein [Blastochloris sp.]
MNTIAPAQPQKSVSTVLTQSVAMLTNPRGAELAGTAARGTLLQASLYVGVVALIAGLLSFPLGISGALRVFLGTVVAFFAFTGLVYTTGQSPQERSPFADVAYTFALFMAPLSLIVPITMFILIHPAIGLGEQVFPILAVGSFLVLLLQAYIAGLVLQRPALKMIDAQSLPAALFVAVVGTWFVQMLVILLKAPWMA